MLTTIIICALGVVFAAVHRCYFDALSRIPGPRLVALQPLWMIWKLWTQRMSRALGALHEKHGSIVRIGPSEISFATISAFDAIYGPFSDRNTTKSGSLSGLAGAVMSESTPSIFTQFGKQDHKNTRTDIQPIFNEMVRGPQERVHDFVFNQHLSRLSGLKDRDCVFNLSAFLDGLLWDIASNVVFGHKLPDRAKVQWERVKGLLPFAAVVIECCSNILGRSLFQRVVHIIALLAEKAGLKEILALQASHFVVHSSKDESNSAKVHSNFMDSLTSGKIPDLRLTPSEAEANLVMLSIAAYDTTFTTVNTTFYFLLQDSAHFKKLREELQSAFSTQDEILDSKLIALPYLNACINESLRMMPPINAKAMQRVSRGVNIDGFYVPKGVAVSADTFSMHRSPVYWQQPESFRPERWIDKQSIDDFRAFRPFSIGPRACPGRLMALQMARLTIAKIVWLNDLDVINDLTEWEDSARSSLLWTQSDIHVRVAGSNPD